MVSIHLPYIWIQLEIKLDTGIDLQVRSIEMFNAHDLHKNETFG